MTRPPSMGGGILGTLPYKNLNPAVLGKIHAEFYRTREFRNLISGIPFQKSCQPSAQQKAACWHSLSGFINWLFGIGPEEGG